MEKSNKDILKELREIAPGLADLKKEPSEALEQDGRSDGFTVPFNYFKELPKEVMSRIEAERATRQLSIWDRIAEKILAFIGSLRQPRMTIALASVTAIIVAGTFLIRPPGTAETDLLADISADAAYEYVLDNIHEFDEREILALFDDEVDIDLTPLDEMSDEELDALFEELNTEELNNI